VAIVTRPALRLHVEPEELDTELAENVLPHAIGTQSLWEVA
jgi:hypothetical protein